jgi:exosortase
MNPTPAAPARLNVAALAPVALTAVALVWAFWTTFLDLAQAWNGNPQYSHGWLVPAFAGLLLWLRRGKLDLAACRPSVLGLPLVAAGLALRLYATYKFYNSLEPLALLPCLAGLVLLFGGRAAWKWAWPAVLFLAFMIPLPYSVAVAMSGPLQRLATIIATFVMQTIGLPALAEGNVILLDKHQIGVVEACSGLRMLVVFFALATAVVLIVKRHWMDVTIILVSAVPIAIVSNITRVTVTGIMYEIGYAEMAQKFFHDVAGWFMMPLALAMLWLELKVMQHLFIDVAAAPAPAKAPAAGANRSVPRPAVPRGGRRAAREQAKAKPAPAPAPVEQPVQQNG